jgi:hypothetical protein
MAGGPIFPHSAFPATAGRAFPGFHVGAGSNVKRSEGLQVESSVGADTTWELQFQMPPTLPTGTGKLMLRAIANAAAGDARVNPKWVSVANGEDPSSATPVAEGVQTISWAAGDADDYKETKVTLDADTLVGGEVVVMALVFETSSWTLGQVSTLQTFVLWE